MNGKVIIKLIAGFVFCSLIEIGFVHQASAQMRIGFNYQLRNAVPKKGYGISLEPTVYKHKKLVVDTRGFFGYYNHNGMQTVGDPKLPADTFNRNIKYYVFGIGGVARYKLPFVNPFISLGIGFNSYKITSRGYVTIKSSYLYNGAVGFEVEPIPYIKPFIEYRYTHSTVRRFQVQFFKPNNSVGRLVVGFKVRL
ncbi:MAG TPA: hypothetical protein VE912_04435 [Bacteroidales bacterium]|nr:hypothetical protein [Bacteroidales bacterium]